MRYAFRSLAFGYVVVALVFEASPSKGEELDDLTCSSPAVLHMVKKLAKQDFLEKVGVPNKLYDVIKAIRTQAPGVCIASYDYAFGPPRGFHNNRSKGDFMDWYGSVAEVVYDFQVTDDKKEVVVHVNGLNFSEAHYGLPRPQEQR